MDWLRATRTRRLRDHGSPRRQGEGERDAEGDGGERRRVQDGDEGVVEGRSWRCPFYGCRISTYVEDTPVGWTGKPRAVVLPVTLQEHRDRASAPRAAGRSSTPPGRGGRPAGCAGLTHRAVDREAGLPEGSPRPTSAPATRSSIALAEHVADQLPPTSTAWHGARGPRRDHDRAVALTVALFARWLDERELAGAARADRRGHPRPRPGRASSARPRGELVDARRAAPGAPASGHADSQRGDPGGRARRGAHGRAAASRTRAPRPRDLRRDVSPSLGLLDGRSPAPLG